MRIGILAFDQVEVLDACGPFEVFSVAARLLSRDPDGRDLTVTMVSAHLGRSSVIARGGLVLGTHASLADAPDFDLLLVPGGVTDEVERDARVVDWLAARAGTPTIASVCTGAFLLAEAGILTDQRVTTHWEDQAALASRYPGLDVVDGPRWIRAGDVYTSAGISAGIDLALHLVDRIEDGLGARVARQMDYDWRA
ncbi:MAG: DJ-1/PfpI family protein [Aeromicrobium sp.]